jgi:acetoin utilization deacetylase AcuC-like enzyme
MKTFFSPQYISHDSGLETTKKPGWIAERISKNGGILSKPNAITQDELNAFLDHDYVSQLFNLTLHSSAFGTKWTADLLKSISHSNGGVRDAVLAAIKDGCAGSLSSGLHHAGKNYGMGFCQVNGLAMGALIAKQNGKRVGILDVDAHCGGGTFNILGHLDIPIADLSTLSLDQWKSSNKIHHLDLFHSKDEKAYLGRVEKALNHLKACDVDFIMHNAGMDPSLSGISKATLNQREEMIAHWCKDNKIGVCWVLAGGYLSYNISESDLVDMHYSTYQHFNQI